MCDQEIILSGRGGLRALSLAVAPRPPVNLLGAQQYAANATENEVRKGQHSADPPAPSTNTETRGRRAGGLGGGPERRERVIETAPRTPRINCASMRRLESASLSE